MTYFSRLTDIVTCNLTAILEAAADPIAALEEIILEMKEGLAGAERSVQTATRNEEGLEKEIQEILIQVEHWTRQARTALAAHDENAARAHLLRKQEAEDLKAGLEQQLIAATGTRTHLTTTLRALQARLNDAQRRLDEHQNQTASSPQSQPLVASRDASIERELEAMKRDLGNA